MEEDNVSTRGVLAPFLVGSMSLGVLLAGLWIGHPEWVLWATTALALPGLAWSSWRLAPVWLDVAFLDDEEEPLPTPTPQEERPTVSPVDHHIPMCVEPHEVPSYSEGQPWKSAEELFPDWPEARNVLRGIVKKVSWEKDAILVDDNILSIRLDVPITAMLFDIPKKYLSAVESRMAEAAATFLTPEIQGRFLYSQCGKTTCFELMCALREEEDRVVAMGGLSLRQRIEHALGVSAFTMSGQR